METIKNVLVGQSGGPTAVINASLAGVYETARAMGAEHVYGMRYGIQGLLQEQIGDLNECLSDKMDIELLKRTPASYLGSCRFRLPNSLMQRNLFFVLTIIFLKDIVCHIRCINRIQLKDSKKTVIQRSLTRSAIIFSMLLWLIKAFFCNFNIKIAEIAPKKLINFMACLSDLKFV